MSRSTEMVVINPVSMQCEKIPIVKTAKHVDLEIDGIELQDKLFVIH